MRIDRSSEAARDAFGELAKLEPKLWSLWELCLYAAPPEPVRDEEDDDGASAADGWCAEDFFIQHVKPTLMVLVGMHRVRPPDELRTAASYDLAYDLLLHGALVRTCACCAPAEAQVEDRRDG